MAADPKFNLRSQADSFDERRRVEQETEIAVGGLDARLAKFEVAACLSLAALDPVPSASNTDVLVGAIDYDDLGLFTGVVGDAAVFTIPEGLISVRLGLQLTVFDKGAGKDRCRLLVQHSTGANVVREELFTDAALTGPTCSSPASRRIEVTPGETFKLVARSQNADCRIQADVSWGPCKFYINGMSLR